MANKRYWTMHSKELVIYPDSAGCDVSALGRHSPSLMSEDDLDSELIDPSIIHTLVADEVLFLPQHLIRLLRLRVQSRMAEDSGDIERAAYFSGTHRNEEHATRKTHSDLMESTESTFTGIPRAE